MNSCVPTTTEIKLYINDSYNYYISKNDKIQIMIIIKTMKMVVIYSILNNNDDDDNCDNGNDNDQLIMTITMKIG